MLLLLQAAAEAPPVVVVTNWPSAITSIFNGLLGGIPALLAAYGIYRSTVNSNAKVEKKTAEINDSVAAQTEQINNTVSAKAKDIVNKVAAVEERTKTAQFKVSQQLDENTELTKDLAPRLITELAPKLVIEINDRIERHKRNNEKQLSLLREQQKRHLETFAAELRRLAIAAGLEPLPEIKPEPETPPHG